MSDSSQKTSVSSEAPSKFTAEHIAHIREKGTPEMVELAETSAAPFTENNITCAICYQPYYCPNEDGDVEERELICPRNNHYVGEECWKQWVARVGTGELSCVLCRDLIRPAMPRNDLNRLVSRLTSLGMPLQQNQSSIRMRAYGVEPEPQFTPEGEEVRGVAYVQSLDVNSIDFEDDIDDDDLPEEYFSLGHREAFFVAERSVTRSFETEALASTLDAFNELIGQTSMDTRQENGPQMSVSVGNPVPPSLGAPANASNVNFNLDADPYSYIGVTMPISQPMNNLFDTAAAGPDQPPIQIHRLWNDPEQQAGTLLQASAIHQRARDPHEPLRRLLSQHQPRQFMREMHHQRRQHPDLELELALSQMQAWAE
ncbi:hypothetical protein B0O99DRAFT_708739 [Bisporella sp. PMI_857]|nr:hypothetical protein B0O99DRAFT_708739 [Bisporella sp. PMI_857]